MVVNNQKSNFGNPMQKFNTVTKVHLCYKETRPSIFVEAKNLQVLIPRNAHKIFSYLQNQSNRLRENTVSCIQNLNIV